MTRKRCVQKYQKEALEDLDKEIQEEENSGMEIEEEQEDVFRDFEGKKVKVERKTEEVELQKIQKALKSASGKNQFENDFIAKMAAKNDQILAKKTETLRDKIKQGKFDEIRFFEK